MKNIHSFSLFCLFFVLTTLEAQISQYSLPEETAKHEGTWLQWPHDHTYGAGYRSFNEPAWIEMTKQLLKGEYVHIVAYNLTEQTHIESVLTTAGISLDSVDFYIHQNDDYWIRDNGPIFITDQDDHLYATDWNFDGWGNDAPFILDDLIPSLVADDRAIPVLNLNTITLEGGAVEHDGNGTFIGTISSITGDGRNPGLTTDDIEEYMTEYFGFTNFIWLDGYYGAGWDVTDAHIDGFVKFIDESTIVTMNTSDLIYWFVSASDRNKINNATNINGDPYNYVYLPLTNKNVKTTTGVNTGSKGDYINYYVANAVVLVPTYNDINDATALSIIQGLYPDKEVVGIDCRNMFAGGGMVHCVTQQQPFTCGVPRNFVVSELTATSATLTWGQIPLTDSYKVTKKIPGGATTNYTVYTNSIVLTGLTPGTTYKLSVKGKCDGSFSDKSNTVTIHTLLRNASNENDVSIYPNPAINKLYIESDKLIANVEIINASGIIVINNKHQPGETINTADLPAGVYVVKVYFEDRVIMKNVMIIK